VASWAEQHPAGARGETHSPRHTRAPRDAPNDSSLAFTATAVDNLGIKSIRIVVSGGIAGVIDTTFTVNSTRITIPYTLNIPTAVQPGTPIILIGNSTDGARNVSAPDTLILTVGGVAPPTVRIVSPVATDAAVVGRQLLITITARASSRSARWATSPVARSPRSTLSCTATRCSSTEPRSIRSPYRRTRHPAR
jgi:hypothetical protein